MDGTTSAAQVRAIELIGRGPELQELAQVLARAIQYETPQSVLLVGNQGVGKSRLLDAWIAAAQDQHPELRILRARAVPGSSAYALFSSLLESRFGLKSATDPQESFRAQVEEVLLDRRLTEVLHFLGVFLGITVRENPFLKALEDAPAQHDQIARTVLRRFLEMDAGRTPLLLAVEDLQHADDASLSLFQELAESLAGAAVVLCGTCRPELFVRVPRLARLEGDHMRVDLGPLGHEDSEALLRRLLSRVRDLPPDLVDTAVDMTGGNPFFLEELVRLLVDNGSIHIDGERWEIDADRVEEVELPMTVEEAVHARIAALSSSERDALEKASVLGGVFWLEGLVCFSRLEQEIAEKSHIWMADVLHQTIKEVLDGLIERDYLMQLPDSSIPDATEYAFKHNLERELITKLLEPGRMRQYHRFAAQWLETKLPDRSEAQLEYLGQHYERGGNHRRAAFCFVHAGDKARGRYANEQAATYYRHGVGQLDLDDALSKIEALHNLGDVCTILGRTAEAMEHFSEMLRLAWLLDHKAKGGAAHRRIGRLFTTLGEYERAVTHLNIALRLFERATDSRGVAATLDDVGQVSMLKGEYDQALDFHRRALSIKKDIGDPRAIAVSLNSIGSVHQSSGSFKAALDCFVEALEIRREVNDRLGVVDSLVNLGGAYRAQSDYARAFQLWTDALKLAREIGDRLHEGYLHINLGEAQLQLGKLREAEQHLADAAAIASDLGDKRLRADCSRGMCEVKLALGDLAGAEEQASAALEISDLLGLRPEKGAALRALAEVVAAHEIDDERRLRSTELFRKAIELFAELGNDLELARTYASFADYHDRCGRWEEADQYRSRADEIFSRLKGPAVSSRSVPRDATTGAPAAAERARLMSSLASIEFEQIPATVVRLCRRLRERGHDAFLVGGGVRDLLLGRPVHDWDLATSARPEEVQRTFARTVPTGIKHGTVTVLEGGLELQVTTFRGETTYSDARHPDSVSFVRSIEEDLSRRDFTINAMALDPVARVLVDPWGGAEDLERRLLRAVGDPLARFGEDGLRAMRAVRFAAVLELAVDPPTLAAIPPVLDRFRRVSAERVRDELLKLLVAPRPSVGIELMRVSGLLGEVLPELLAGFDLTQNRFHAEDVYWHSLHACDGVPADPILRLAALLHDIGKPVTAAPHATREGENAFHAHEHEGAQLCDAIARRLKLSNEERERLCHLVAHHMIQLEGWSSPGLRRLLRRVGLEHLDDLFALRAADLGGRPEAETRLAQLAELRQRLDGLAQERPPLDTRELAIDGKAVMERLGIPPGRRIGEILRALLERVLEDPSLNEREALLKIVDELGAAS